MRQNGQKRAVFRHEFANQANNQHVRHTGLASFTDSESSSATREREGLNGGPGCTFLVDFGAL